MSVELRERSHKLSSLLLRATEHLDNALVLRDKYLEQVTKVEGDIERARMTLERVHGLINADREDA